MPMAGWKFRERLRETDTSGFSCRFFFLASFFFSSASLFYSFARISRAAVDPRGSLLFVSYRTAAPRLLARRKIAESRVLIWLTKIRSIRSLSFKFRLHERVVASEDLSWLFVLIGIIDRWNCWVVWFIGTPVNFHRPRLMLLLIPISYSIRHISLTWRGVVYYENTFLP